jgi:cobalt-zinc-cadmium efflux system membrane fusion protein
MNLRFWMALLSLVLGCKAGSSEANERHSDSKPRAEAVGPQAPEHVDEPEHEELPKLVRLTREVIASAAIRTAKVAREALPITVSLPGELVADPDKTARISSPVAGRIEQVSFKEGSVVKKGDVLAILRVPDLAQVRSTYSSSLAKAKAARANAERLKELSAQRLASEQAYLDAAAQADALEIEANAAEQRLSAFGTAAGKGAPSQIALRAPIAGTVVLRNAVVGQPVTSDETIGEIVELSELWFLARVFEKDLSRLHVGANAEVQLNAYPDERFAGSVEYIGKQVDPNARTLTARIRLQNSQGKLSVGLFGTAFVSTSERGTRKATLVILRSALTEVAGKPVVFVRHPDGDFELHDVVLGESAGGKVEIVSGLREGEEVVVDGVFTLKSAVLKTTFAEDE